VKFCGQAGLLGARRARNKKLALDPQSLYIDNLEAVIEPHVFCYRPTRDEPDPQTCFYRRFDSLG
jgi:hypothetical protein